MEYIGVNRRNVNCRFKSYFNGDFNDYVNCNCNCCLYHYLNDYSSSNNYQLRNYYLQTGLTLWDAELKERLVSHSGSSIPSIEAIIFCPPVSNANPT